MAVISTSEFFLGDGATALFKLKFAPAGPKVNYVKTVQLNGVSYDMPQDYLTNYNIVLFTAAPVLNDRVRVGYDYIEQFGLVEVHA